MFSPIQPTEQSPDIHPDTLLDTYFARFHDKPFHIFDESTLRQRLQLHQVPGYLVNAIHAVAARYANHPSGYQSAVKLSEDYAAKARREIDTDEPSVDAVQALVLLVTAFTASGKGKKAYMLLRRSSYGCRAGFQNPNSIPMEGDFFQSYTNLQHLQGGGKKSQGSSGCSSIFVASWAQRTSTWRPGVKGDSHFPWHSLSNLSKIRQDLDVWASGTQDVFSSVESLFGQADSTVLVLSKLIYHLIHCLIYRPFLPIDLAELAGSGQHQSWQIEATNMCFLHANAIAELVELGKQTASVEWPAFVGYCISTAGTVHIHGAHYSRIGTAGDMNVFSSSADFLSREMQQLSELRYAWASVQHQRETLQGIYNAHSELIKSIAQSPMQYSAVFTLEDFFDRYSNIGGPGGESFSFDSANLSLADVVVDFTTDTYPGQGLYAPRLNASDPGPSRSSLKRKNTAPSGRTRPELKSLLSLGNMNPPPTPGLSAPSTASRPLFSPSSLPPQPSPGMLHTPCPSPHLTGSLIQTVR
ncbi:hypothetical protein NEMBOFW57_006092 [Staphylotrichum longicolle]|uniref:Xylanolytic transcriptional activator regulatory domain-containing protein n=1 Tax=Staphylotrichum longicolle TaxID=669026 RepID=A0AAD4EYD9_9PEZI|nr:hypothetical protein NEMBOFW57_006092 [Staphylotrichum longicolle]